LLNKTIAKTLNSLFYYPPPTQKSFLFKTSKSVDKGLKNYYITLDKTTINKDKNTYEKQVFN